MILFFFIKGFDDVYMCKRFASGQGTVENYFNPGGYQASQIFDANDRTLGLSNISVEVIDGQLRCSFTRATSLAAGRQVSQRNIANFVDLNNRFFLLTSNGNLVNGTYFVFLKMRLKIHFVSYFLKDEPTYHVIRQFSPAAIDFNQGGDVIAEEPEGPERRQAHG